MESTINETLLALLVSSNLILAVMVIITGFMFFKRKDEIKELKKELLDAKLISNNAPLEIKQNELRAKKIIVTLCTNLRYIKDTDQDIGKLKKSLFRFFSDFSAISLMLNDYINDEEIYNEVLEYLENDLKYFLINEKDTLDTNKFFKIIEKVDL